MQVSEWEQKRQVLRAFALWKESGANIDFRPAKYGNYSIVILQSICEIGHNTKQGQGQVVLKSWKQTDTFVFLIFTSGEKADISISWQVKDHGDAGKRSFDGPGGTLAHAFYPCLF